MVSTNCQFVVQELPSVVPLALKNINAAGEAVSSCITVEEHDLFSKQSSCRKDNPVLYILRHIL
jgi:hypothetical protein